MSLSKHRKDAPKKIDCAIITVSDTRTYETDASGNLILRMLKEAGHVVLEENYIIVKDEYDKIREVVLACCSNKSVKCVVINGGTGLAMRDVTIEAVESVLDKKMDGFGELFRYLSYKKDIGSAAILSRATAGVSNQTVIFSVPGSKGAVRLAMEELILPEIAHIVGEVWKDE